MASELAKRHALDWAHRESTDDRSSLATVADAIDRAIHASHAQRTRREGKALESARHHVGPIGMQAIRDALRRARRGSK